MKEVRLLFRVKFQRGLSLNFLLCKLNSVEEVHNIKTEAAKILKNHSKDIINVLNLFSRSEHILHSLSLANFKF